MSDQHLFFTLTNSVVGEQEEFNRWYNTEHVPDVLKLPEFLAARRYRLNPAQREPGPGMWEQQTPPWEYLCVYEVRGEPAEIHQKVASTMHLRTRTHALRDDHQAWVWTPLGDRVVSLEA